MIQLRIPEATPSANKYLWAHWRVKDKSRVHWGWLVRVARLEADLKPEPLPKAIVTVDRYGKRKLDHDNYVAGCKALLDALVVERFIEGDSPDHIDVTYRQHKASSEHTVVSICPV